MKLATAVAGLVLAVLTSSVGAQQSIMVIGDSLSAGVERPSYRKPLLDDLASLDCAVDMVGTQALNSFSVDSPDSQPDAHFPGFDPGAGYDTDHQAFSGMRVVELLNGAAKADFVAQPIANYTSNAQPDFILLHLGTDDLYATIESGVTTPAALDRWAETLSTDIETMIRQIIERHETPSELRILVGNFVPYNGPFSEQAQRSAAASGSAILRNKIETRIREMRDSRVLIVDVARGFDIESMSTVNAAPNAAGEQHIAGSFLSVLRGAGLCPDSAPSISTPNNGGTLAGSPGSIACRPMICP